MVEQTVKDKVDGKKSIEDMTLDELDEMEDEEDERILLQYRSVKQNMDIQREVRQYYVPQTAAYGRNNGNTKESQVWVCEGDIGCRLC